MHGAPSGAVRLPYTVHKEKDVASFRRQLKSDLFSAPYSQSHESETERGQLTWVPALINSLVC